MASHPVPPPWSNRRRWFPTTQDSTEGSLGGCTDGFTGCAWIVGDVISPSESQSRTAVSDSLQPYGLHSPWNSPGQNTGVGSLSLLQGIFPSQGLNPDGKASAYNSRDLGSIPGSRRSPGEGNGNPLQYSCLENPMGQGIWWATVHGVIKRQT